MTTAAPSNLGAIRERHLDLLGRGDRRTALTEATELLAQGMPLADFILDVLAPVQAEIGRRWQRGQITTADERVATEVADILLAVAAGRHQPGSSGVRLVLCVADNEHHNLPARMVTELLRAEGHHVTFLGAPKPSRTLGEMIRKLEPHAVVISCSLAMNLPGTVGLAGLAHEAGLPVVVGGAGFAGSAQRAVKVGADSHAGRVGDVPELATGSPRRDFAAGPPNLRTMEWAGLMHARKKVAAEVAEQMIWQSSTVVPRSLRTSPRALTECASDMLRFVEAAALVEDQILIDYARWHHERYSSLGSEPEFTQTLLRTVRDQVAVAAPHAAQAADAAACVLA